MAIAVIEKLLEKSCFVMFATHFLELTKLSKFYPSIRNIHLKTSIDRKRDTSKIASTQDTSCELVIKHSREIVEGPSLTEEGFGIVLSELSGFPNSIIEDANKAKRLISSSSTIDFMLEIELGSVGLKINDILQSLSLAVNGKNSDEEIFQTIKEIRGDIPKHQVESILKFINDETSK